MSQVAGDPTLSVRQHYQQGMICWREGRYESAVVHLTEISRAEGLMSLLANFYRGLASHALGLQALQAASYAEAARHLRAAIEANPTGMSLPYLLSACAVVGSDLVEGEPFVADWLLPQTRQTLPADLSRALGLWRNGHNDRAIALLRDLLFSEPANAQVYHHLGLMLSSASEYEEAISCFQTAARLQPADADIFSGLGLTYSACRQFDRALDAFQRAHEVKPADAKISLSLTMAAQCLDATGRRVEIRLRAAQAGATLVHDEPMLESLGELFCQEPDLAEVFLDLPQSPTDNELFAMLAAALRRGMARRRGFADLQLLLARVLERVGAHDQAIVAAREAVAGNPGYVDALVFLARQCGQRGDPVEAVRMLEGALATGVRYADVYYLLGEQFEAIGKMDQAIDAYRLALEINSDYGAAKQALARIAA